MDFLKLSPAQIGDLVPEELADLAVYLLTKEGARVISRSVHTDWIDIVVSGANGGREYLRFYFVPTPINAIYELLGELQGKNYLKVRFWANSNLTPAQRRVRRDASLVLEIAGLRELQEKLIDQQRRIRFQNKATPAFDWPIRRAGQNLARTQNYRWGSPPLKQKTDKAAFAVMLALTLAAISIGVMIFQLLFTGR